VKGCQAGSGGGFIAGTDPTAQEGSPVGWRILRVRGYPTGTPAGHQGGAGAGSDTTSHPAAADMGDYG